MIELLAPAGGPDSIQAAVRCGADAVYLGGESFSARANAKTFLMNSFARLFSIATFTMLRYIKL
jgi:collagenase-like PrtC family protease